MYHSVHPPTPCTAQWYRLQVSNAMATGQDQKVGPNLLLGWMGLSNHSCLQGGHMWHPRGSAHEFTFWNTHRSLHRLYFALGCAQQTASAVLHRKRREKKAETNSKDRQVLYLAPTFITAQQRQAIFVVCICLCVIFMLVNGSTCYTHLLLAVSTNNRLLIASGLKW